MVSTSLTANECKKSIHQKNKLRDQPCKMLPTISWSVLPLVHFIIPWLTHLPREERSTQTTWPTVQAGRAAARMDQSQHMRNPQPFIKGILKQEIFEKMERYQFSTIFNQEIEIFQKKKLV